MGRIGHFEGDNGIRRIHKRQQLGNRRKREDREGRGGWKREEGKIREKEGSDQKKRTGGDIYLKL